jgi:penicillin-binding protein 2
MPRGDDPDSFSAVRPRVVVVACIFIALVITLLIGLFNVQILDFQNMSDMQKRQNYRRIVIPGPRGDIYDREGRLLVGNRPMFSAVVYLNELRLEFRKEYILLVNEYRDRGIAMDREQVASLARQRVVQRYMNVVNSLIGTTDTVDSRTIERHFNRELLLPFILHNDLTLEQYARLIEQVPVDSPIQVMTESARYYPYGRLAAHTLGFVVSSEDTDGGDDDTVGEGEDLRTFRVKGKSGRTGLELSMDDVLQGAPGGEIWVVDPSGYQHRRIEFKSPVKGKNVKTSLDVDIQQAAEAALGDNTGAVVVMDIRTGEVLAMASEPAYDLNTLSPFIPSKVYNDITDRGAWINRAIQGLYPPGSTFKIATSVAGFSRGVLRPNTVINCPGYLMVGGRMFKCDNHDGHGDLDLPHAIGESCDVFFYTVGLNAGVDAMASTGRMFGFDKPTGIELPHETLHSVVPDPAFKKRRFREGWYGGDTANMSIGQGYLLVTPLQMCCFSASIARGMTITRPTLLKVGEKQNRNIGGVPIPIPNYEYNAITEGMRLCVTEGTGRLVQRKINIPISGKTGTAQIHINGRESTIAWFMCYAPSDNPRVAVAVMIEGVDPGDNLFGGSTSAPIARAVIQAWENKYMPPIFQEDDEDQ